MGRNHFEVLAVGKKILLKIILNIKDEGTGQGPVVDLSEQDKNFHVASMVENVLSS
jgi:hypothetical protein